MAPDTAGITDSGARDLSRDDSIEQPHAHDASAATQVARSAVYRLISITAVGVRPKTSGEYISSARAGAVRNVPAVVARTM